MKYQGRKIANSFYLPKHPFLRGIARLVDFQGALNRDTLKQILEQYDTEPQQSDAEARQSDAEAIRAAWEAVGDRMRWAINQYEKEISESNR